MAYGGGLTHPDLIPVDLPSPLATLIMDYYPGGWQETFPNGGAPSSYPGASFGQHGDVSNVPRDYEIVEDDQKAVAVRFSVRTQKTPFFLEKVLRLRSGEDRLHVEETLKNESDVSLRAMWSQHIAFGRPFLKEGCRIRLLDGVTVVPHDEPIHPDGRRDKRGESYSWPFAEGESDELIDPSMPPLGGTLSEMLHLTDLSEGWYEVENPEKRVGLRVEWDVDRIPYLWFWQEYGASEFYPWYGGHYNIGLEPFSSFPTNGLLEAVDNGTVLSIATREERRFSLRIEVIEGDQAREGGGR